MYEIFTRGEQIISNNNIIFTKMKSDDNERLNALEMIRFDLLYETKKYSFSECFPHIIKLIQTSKNPKILDSATWCLRTAVEVTPDNVEMFMSSSTIEIISRIFNQQISKSSTEHTIHILNAMSKYYADALSNSINYFQILQYINDNQNSDIEKRLLSLILLNITEVSVSPHLVNYIHPLIGLCSNHDNQIAFNSLSSLINIAKGSDALSVPVELTAFLCDKLMDPKLYKIHNKIIELLTKLAKDSNHAFTIHQKKLDFEKLLFSPEFIHTRTDFKNILIFILNLLPYFEGLSVFKLSNHQRPHYPNDLETFQFSREIQKIMKKVIIEKPLDVKTALIAFAVTLECAKEEEENQKRKEQQNNDISNYLYDTNCEDENMFAMNNSNFGSDYEVPFFEDSYDKDDTMLQISDDDNGNNKKNESNETVETDSEIKQETENTENLSQNQELNENNDEIDNDLLLALISFSMVQSNAPYILAVISYYGNSKKLNECYLLQLIKDFPIQIEYADWFRKTIKTLESKLSQIGTPRPLVNLSNLTLQKLNQLALDDQIPSYQFLFGGGVKVCKKLLDEEKIMGDESASQIDVSGIAKLSLSLVSFLPMPCIVNEPSMEEFVNILINPAPVSIISKNNCKFKSTVPLIEPIWTLKGLIDMTVNHKNTDYLLRLMNNNPKLAQYIRSDYVEDHSLSYSNTAILIKAFEHNYGHTLNNSLAGFKPNSININNLRIGSNTNFLQNSSANNLNLLNLRHFLSTNVLHSNDQNSQNRSRGNQPHPTNFNFNASSNSNFVRRRFEIDNPRNTNSNTNFIRQRNDNNSNMFFVGNSFNSSNSNNININGNNQSIKRAQNNSHPIDRTNINNSANALNNSYEYPEFAKKGLLNIIAPTPIPQSPYPDYKNNSLFSVFCDKATTSIDVFKIQPEISLDAKPTEMKFQPLPNQYFTDLFGLLKELHENYNIVNVENTWKKSEGLSFVSRVHEQFSNPFGSIGRKSYAMTIIFKYPFLFPFSERILAYKLVYLDPYFATRRLIGEFKSFDPVVLRKNRPEPLKLQVSRDTIFEDGCELLKNFFSHKIEVDVKFVGEKGFGMGPTREFLSNMSHEFCRNKHNLFRNDSMFSTNDSEFSFSKNGLFPAPNARPELFKLIGILVAKAISMEINLALDFNPAFFEIARGKKISVSQVDEIFANSLNCPNDLLDVEFTYPGYPSLELKPNGKQLIVNEENVNEYIELVKNSTIDGNVKKCAEMFVSGFNKILPFSSLDIFSEKEISSFICGDKELIKSSDLLKYCQIDGGLTSESPEIKMLCQFIDKTDIDGQKDFIKFVTGLTNLPCGGLKVLEPKMTIVRKCSTSVNGMLNPDQELPTANTCNCTLKLPPYSDPDILSEKFKFAFSFGNNEFGLS
ncbi:hypothetical protein M9Y10_009224 [Tritrichomonas musculus]|uniref:HECT-type E3 ubiquitin transferase n=1 Tax=Tritrichomonas musculus TaxID=1915356 RepID=A0ABR2INZ6_9EUKA